VISALELCLNHVERDVLIERVDIIESLLLEGHAAFANLNGHTVLIKTPAPTLPPLPLVALA